MESTIQTPDIPEKMEVPEVTENAQPARGLAFWLIFLVLGVVSMLSAFEASVISTALPQIVTDLHGERVYIWFISSYLITATIFMPIWGQMADIFGRRVCLVASILFFLVGSALSGATTNYQMLIAGRTIQGIGGGGNLALTEIIISDIVSLRERGKFVGIIGGVWSFSTVIGPIIGGALAHQWRYIFYLNVPISAIAAVLAAVFLKLKEPSGSVWQKAKKIDVVGAIIFLASLIAIQFALAEGGINFPWTSWHILVPLVMGFLGLGCFILWIRFCHILGTNPLIPISLFHSTTANIGYGATFIHGALVFAMIYILPVYFEGIRDFSALQTGVQFFSFTFVTAPFAIVAGAIIAMTGKYKVLNIVAFALMTTGAGLFQILSPSSPRWHWIVFQMVFAFGAGLLFTCSLAPIQASVKTEQIAAATALYAFMRNFGSVFGIAITTSIFNYKMNVLSAVLPNSISSLLKDGGGFAVSTVGYKVFGDSAAVVSQIAIKSLRYSFWAMFALAGFGFFITFFYENLHLSTELEGEYGMTEKKKSVEVV